MTAVKPNPRLLSNMSLSLAVSLLSRATGFLLFFLIARRVTTNGVGVYALAVNYVTLLIAATTLGHNDPITRDIAKHPSLASIYLGHFTVLRFLAGVFSYALLVALVTVGFHYPVATTVVLLVMGLSIIPDGLTQLFRSLFIAFERQSYYAATSVVVSFVNLALVWSLLRSDANLEVVAWIRLLAMTLGLVMSVVLSTRLVPWSWLHSLLRPHWAWIGRQLRSYLPFTLIAVFYAIEWRVDILVLSASHSQSEIGRYYAAETLLISLLVLLEAYRLAALPRMSKLLQEDPPGLAFLHDRSLWYLLAAAMAIAVGTTMLGPQLLDMVNPGFSAITGMLAILMIALVISFLNEPNGLLMIASGYQKQLVSIFVVSLAVNVAANLALTPLLGGVGAAIARVLSVGTFSLIAAILVSRQIRAHRPFHYAVPVVLAAAGMAATLWYLQQVLPWWLAGFTSMVVYVLLLIMLRGIPVDDLKRLRCFLRSGKTRIVRGPRSAADTDDPRPFSQ